MELQSDFIYQAFSYRGSDYLFGINGYEGMEAKGVLYNLSIDGIDEVVKFNTETDTFDWRKKEDILRLDKYYEDGNWKTREKYVGFCDLSLFFLRFPSKNRKTREKCVGFRDLSLFFLRFPSKNRKTENFRGKSGRNSDPTSNFREKPKLY